MAGLADVLIDMLVNDDDDKNSEKPAKKESVAEAMVLGGIPADAYRMILTEVEEMTYNGRTNVLEAVPPEPGAYMVSIYPIGPEHRPHALWAIPLKKD